MRVGGSPTPYGHASAASDECLFVCSVGAQHAAPVRVRLEGAIQFGTARCANTDFVPLFLWFRSSAVPWFRSSAVPWFRRISTARIYSQGSAW
jgi:hypothetical protein